MSTVEALLVGLGAEIAEPHLLTMALELFPLPALVT